MSENSTKIKLLKLYEILRAETDEEHPISRVELCERVHQQGVPCHVRTLSRDIATLNKFGYEVCSFKKDHEKFYYLPDNDFSIPELKILIDAVQAANFVTEKKTTELIEKIAMIGGSHRKELLKRNMAYFNSRKHSNECILYNIDGIETAIRGKKRIAFNYFDLNEKKQRVYRPDDIGEKKRYEVEPIALILNEDNYYLMAYSDHHPDSTANYRVDRMDQVEVLEDSTISPEALAKLKTVRRYTAQTFKMFNGELADVKLQFDRSLIGPVLDKFGEGVRMRKVDKATCSATVTVQVAPTFFGWLAQFGDKMRIVEPEGVREAYRAHIALINGGTNEN